MSAQHLFDIFTCRLNDPLVRMGMDMWGSPLKELNDTPHLSRVLMRLFHPTVAAKAVAAAGLKADITAPTPEAPSIAKALTLYMQQENK